MPVFWKRGSTRKIGRFFRLFSVLLLLSGVFFFLHAQTVVAAGWYDVAWSYRVRITLDHTKVGSSTATTITNFPVLVATTTSSLKYTGFSGRVGKSNAGDVLFTSSDGTTKLYHEVEKYSSTTGQLITWVNTPTVSSTTDTVLYMYYGNASAADQASTTGAWSESGTSNFKGVWHLADGQTLSPNDSTWNVNNGTIIASASAATGTIDGGLGVNGSGQYVRVPMSNITSVTISTWAKTGASGCFCQLIHRDQTFSPGTNRSWQFRMNTSNLLEFIPFSAAGSNGDVIATGKAINDGVWHHLVATYNQTTESVYVDGVRLGTNTSLSGALHAGDTVYFGAHSNAFTGGSDWTGSIDEVRISDTARSADWIKTEYNNQQASSTFVVMGNQESSPVPTDLAATPGNTQASLTWTAPDTSGGSPVTDYVVDYKLSSDVSWTTFADGVSTATSATVTGLVNGSAYDFRVSAIIGGVQQDPSATASATPRTVPGAPTSVSATPGSTQAFIAFGAPVSNGGATVTSYTVTSSPGGFTNSGGTSPITVSGLTNGTPYTFTVTASNIAGTGSASSATEAVTPDASLNWYSVSWPYRFRISIDRTKVASSSVNTLLTYFPVLISTTSPMLKYTAFGGHAGKSDATDLVFTSSDGITKIPHEIETYSSTTGQLIAWVQVPSMATTTDTNVFLYYGYAAASNQQNITGTWNDGGSAIYQGVWHLASSTNPTDSTSNANNGVNVGNATSTTGQIDGAISVGNSAAPQYEDVPISNVTSVTISAWAKTTQGGQVTHIVNRDQTSGGSNRSWQFRMNASNKFEFIPINTVGAFGTVTSLSSMNDGNWHYLVATYDQTTSKVFFDGVQEASNGSVSGALHAGDHIYIGAHANSFVGGADFYGQIDDVRVSNSPRSADWIKTEYSNQSSPSTFFSSAAEEVLTAPDYPTDLHATPGNTQVALTWTAPTLHGAAVTDYIVDYKLSSDSSWTTFSDGVSIATSATVTGLTNGSSYDFRVSAASGIGQSLASPFVTSTPYTTPGAPTSVTASAGNTQATVSFTAPSNGGSAITSYTVTSSPGSFIGTGSTSPITVTGLTNGVAYTFTVTATNAAGTGSASSASNSVTPADLPGVPTALLATAGNTQVALSWSAPAYTGGVALTDYVVEFKTSAGSIWTVFSDGVSNATSSTVTGLTNGTPYDFRVSAVNSAGQGSPSSTTSATPITVPSKPLSATATLGNTRATISFSAPASNGGSAITSYTATSNPGGFSTSSSASPLVATGLTNGVSYTFTVTATNAAGTGPASDATNAVTPATIPDAPTSPVAVAGNAQATITFDAPGSNGGSAILYYTASSSPGGFTKYGSASPLTVTGLSNGTVYTFSVTATNAAGTSTPSVDSNAVTPVTVPDAPTIGTATPGNASVSVAFSAPASNGGSAITGYSAVAIPSGMTGTGATSPITVAGLSNGTAYTFIVKATNAVGSSASSTESNSATPRTVPDAPTGLTPTAGNMQVALTWTAPVSNGGAAITDYVIEYKLTADSLWTTFSDGVSAVTSGSVTGLVNGSSYDFRVSAVNEAGQGAASATATATPISVPDAPTIGTATAGNAQATVTFTPSVSDGGSPITVYTVTSSPGNITGTGSGSPITVTGLSNGTAYTFTVTATNAVGDSAASAASNSVTPFTVPDAPTSLSATPGNTQASIAFTAPSANGSAITSYLVASSPGGFTGTGSASPIVVTGLTNGQSYTFTASALNAAGRSATSSASNSITLSTEPGAPTNLAATVLGSSISLSWSAPASNGGSAVTDYVIEYQLSTGGVWAVFSDGTSSGTTATVTGLSNGTSYDFRVSAANVIGTGVPSGTVTATPGEPAQVLIQSFPDLTAQSIGTAVRITNEGSSSFEYQYTWCVTDADNNLCGGGNDIFSGSNAKLILAGENYDTTLVSTVSVPGTYWFHISVTYGSESSSAFQSFIAVATFPDAPTSVSGVSGNGQVTVSFSAPSSNGGSAITGYTVTSNPGGFTASGAASPLVVSGLTNGIPYTFTVTATNTSGEGPASAASAAVTPATLPNAPTGLSASPQNGSVGLSWSAPAFDGGSPITDYVVEYKLSSDSSYSVFSDGVSAATSATVTGLVNGQSYDFRVSAVNAVGQSSVTGGSGTPSPQASPSPSSSPSSGGGGGGGFSYPYVGEAPASPAPQPSVSGAPQVSPAAPGASVAPGKKPGQPGAPAGGAGAPGKGGTSGGTGGSQSGTGGSSIVPAGPGNTASATPSGSIKEPFTPVKTITKTVERSGIWGMIIAALGGFSFAFLLIFLIKLFIRRRDRRDY